MPDIDIDFADRSQVLDLFDHITASRSDNTNLAKHNTGIYLHECPIDLDTGFCKVPYDAAEDQGYFKIDFLNASLYKGIKNEDHLIQLMNQEPLWDLLEDDGFNSLLFHVNGHGDILRKMKPKSVDQLAAILAMIRPAKRYLIGKSWEEIMKEVWIKPSGEEYYFKKSHATAYAVAIVVQMNLICEQISYGYS
jgi:DNA polymerase III alpha subunit